jgi:hypothetical protein
VALTVTRSPHINPDASFSKVDTLRQSRRWGRNRHCANKSKSDQRSRNQHGFFLLFCRSGKTAKVCARSYGTSANGPRRLTGFIQLVDLIAQWHWSKKQRGSQQQNHDTNKVLGRLKSQLGEPGFRLKVRHA